jgi:hypothetical protein
MTRPGPHPLKPNTLLESHQGYGGCQGMETVENCCAVSHRSHTLWKTPPRPPPAFTTPPTAPTTG